MPLPTRRVTSRALAQRLVGANVTHDQDADRDRRWPTRSRRPGRTSRPRRRPSGRMGCAPSGFRPSVSHPKDPRSACSVTRLRSLRRPLTAGASVVALRAGAGRLSGRRVLRTNVQLRLRPPPWNPPDMPTDQPWRPIMRTRISIMVIGVLTALALIAVPAATAATDVHRATLKGSASFPAVTGSAKFSARQRRPASSRPRSSTQRCSPASRCGSASTDSSSAPRPSTRSAGRASTRAAAWFRPCPQARRSGSESWAALWSRPAAFPDRRW